MLCKSSLGLAQFHKPSSTALCKSHSSYSWNYSSKFDTLINQDDHAAPIRNPVRGRTSFSKSRDLRASVPSLAPPPPASSLFALAPIYARPKCEKALRTGTLATQNTATCNQRFWHFLFAFFSVQVGGKALHLLQAWVISEFLLYSTNEVIKYPGFDMDKR